MSTTSNTVHGYRGLLELLADILVRDLLAESGVTESSISELKMAPNARSDERASADQGDAHEV